MEKAVKLATKPKRASPKAKYVDPIIQGTFAQDGSLQEIIKALGLRLRDENTTVILKSLLLLHVLLRSGSLTPTFTYLSASSLSLSLSSTETPNLAAYAAYLAARIRAWGTLKRDVIRDATERERRVQGRLRNLKVEEGLLRETREVQRMIAAAVEAKFYLDDIDDDVSMTALRLLVKDLLVLFQSVNEGVINVLEHYFEMSHTDATTALKIYKTFCKDTEKVVVYLGVVKKLHKVLNIQVPNLKHAPVSLVSSLEEYLNDPNFATNREEYKENKRIADGGKPSATPKAATPSTSTSSSTPAPAAAAAAAPTTFTDFFESIEQAQTTMFNPNPTAAAGPSPTEQYFYQQAAFNPFLQQPQASPFGPFGGAYGGGLVPQATGMGYAAFGQQPQFLQPQMTASPFGQQPSPFAPQQSSLFAPPQQQYPMMTGYAQPQMPMMTGAPNPFRQTAMPTGFPSPSPFAQHAAATSSFSGNPNPSPFLQSMPVFSPATTKLQPQATGSKNPFGPTSAELGAAGQRANAGLSMQALSLGNGQSSSPFGQQQQPQRQQSMPPPPQQPQYQQQQAPPPQQQSMKTGMGAVASEFAFARPTPATSPPPSNLNNNPFPSTSATPYNTAPSTPFPSSAFSAPFQPQQVNQSYSTQQVPQQLQSQQTGVKRFVPTSSFGTELEAELGGNAAGGNGGGGMMSPQMTGFNPFRAGQQGQGQAQAQGPGMSGGNGQFGFNGGNNQFSQGGNTQYQNGGTAHTGSLI